MHSLGEKKWLFRQNNHDLLKLKYYVKIKQTKQKSHVHNHDDESSKLSTRIKESREEIFIEKKTFYHFHCDSSFCWIKVRNMKTFSCNLSFIAQKSYRNRHQCEKKTVLIL